MYACSCLGVTDSTVRTVIASGAGTVEEIGARCGAGTDCGGCHVLLERLLAQAVVARPASRHSAA